MAGLISNLLEYIRTNDEFDEYEEFDEVDEVDEVQEEVQDNNPRRSERKERKMFKNNKVTETEEEMPKKERYARSEKQSKVVPMRSSAKGLEVCIVKPTSFEDSQEVCSILLSGRACVVNLEGFDADDAQRIMDFISGCIFAIEGKLHRISKYIFIFSPENVDISGDYLDFMPEDKKNTLTINKEF